MLSGAERPTLLVSKFRSDSLMSSETATSYTLAFSTASRSAASLCSSTWIPNNLTSTVFSFLSRLMLFGDGIVVMHLTWTQNSRKACGRTSQEGLGPPAVPPNPITSSPTRIASSPNPPNKRAIRYCSRINRWTTILARRLSTTYAATNSYSSKT
ncbi:hypothetical protein M404DRAFT_292531 [Pisolithus tinctorius Marx 270]|uniref:Uncharacterized protein n=1 Tax=Pisolithus tinctorius Marx 270 TaxID=870435 RepID=A0A0C3NL31_PISTI|nr:hypothetical protein M404DRAFT_292531 [Pisolithus tinctorius Marx 270]